MRKTRLIWVVMVLVVIISGCRPIEGMQDVPEVKEDGVTQPVNESPKETSDDNPIIEEPPTESPKMMKLDRSKAEELQVSDDVIDTLHDTIEDPNYPDEVVIQAIFTDGRLTLLREHLSLVTYNFQKQQIGIISDPSSLYVLCNKLNQLTEDYVPESLSVPDVPFSFSNMDMKKQLRPVAGEALSKLFEASLLEDIHLVAVSGYRSYDRQKSVYWSKANSRGVEAADQVSARPGHSEHQTGLTIDVSSAEIGYGLEVSFAKTKEGQWLKDNAYKYGFIVRYPLEAIALTGYAFEPWHIRYVGEDLASFMKDYDLTLEELYWTLLSYNQ